MVNEHIKLSARPTPWCIQLSEYHFEIKEKKVLDKNHDDSLSCLLIGNPIKPTHWEDIQDSSMEVYSAQCTYKKYYYAEEYILRDDLDQVDRLQWQET